MRFIAFTNMYYLLFDCWKKVKGLAVFFVICIYISHIWNKALITSCIKTHSYYIIIQIVSFHQYLEFNFYKINCNESGFSSRFQWIKGFTKVRKLLICRNMNTELDFIEIVIEQFLCFLIFIVSLVILNTFRRFFRLG